MAPKAKTEVTKPADPFITTFTPQCIHMVNSLSSQFLENAVPTRTGWVSRLPHTNIHLEYIASEIDQGTYDVSEMVRSSKSAAALQSKGKSADFLRAMVFIMNEMERGCLSGA